MGKGTTNFRLENLTTSVNPDWFQKRGCTFHRHETGEVVLSVDPVHGRMNEIRAALAKMKDTWDDLVIIEE